MNKTEWFVEWFDTKYYHILYKNRNNKEAQIFIENLLTYLNPKKTDNFLDLACGKGRHSFFLSKKGFDVSGCDLSQESINFANSLKREKLRFFVHDMRDELPNKYSFILNLFTSFGYFDKMTDNSKVLNSVKKGLSKNGVFMVDFFNSEYVINNLKPRETKTIDGIKFYITKEIKDNHIIKNITFKHDNKNHSYFEKVQLLTIQNFEALTQQNELKINNTFGDYNLNSFHKKKSKRLILEIKND